MKKTLIASIVLFWAVQDSAQLMDPEILDLDAFGREFLPVIREFDPRIDSAVVAIRTIESPRLSKAVVIAEESDLTQTSYDNSFVKAFLIEGGNPQLVIEIGRYRSFNISWLNEELFHVSNWPGRCVELHTIYSTLEDRVIYQRGFNHCGV